MYQFTQHGAQRAAQRNLTKDEIEYILYFGSRLHKAGVVFFYLRNQDIPSSDQRIDHLSRLAGTAVVLSKDRRYLITTWRNRRIGFKKIMKKPEFDANPE